MKRFFLIPLMTLLTCVMAWGENVAVAQIGETTYYKGDAADTENHIYATVNAALTATVTDVANEGTIKLLNNATGQFNLSSGLNKTITFDLNGKTLTCTTGININGGSKLILVNTDTQNEGCINNTSTSTVYVSAIRVQANAELEINDGVIVQTSGKLFTVYGYANSTITINGGTIKHIGATAKDVVKCDGGTLTMNDGTIESTTKWDALYAQGGAQVTINGGVIKNTCPAENSDSGNTYVIDVYGNTSGSGDPIATTLNINGGTIIANVSQQGYGISIWGNGATLNMNGGSIITTMYAISGNGTAEYAGTTINISGGAIGTEETKAAIYHPQAGTLNISGNPVVKGRSGIQLCAGVGLTGSITGGRFEACGTDDRAIKDGDGYIHDGAALSIVNRNYPGGMPQFTIKGGVFLAQHQDAILAYNWDSSQPMGSRHSAWAEAASHLSAREGIFSSNPTPFVPADGYIVTHLDPTPTVYNHDAVVYADLWQIGEESYVQSYDFTEEQAEYVEINATTAAESPNIEGTIYTLNEDQSSKKVEVAEDYTLVVSEDVTLNIGNGGLDLNAGSQVVVEPGAVVTVGTNGITSASGTDNLVLEANSEKQAVLLIDPDVIQNTQPLATVILSTKARQKSANPWNYIWEYFASPVAEITPSTKPTNNFDEAVHGLFAGETEFVTGVYTWGGNDWALVNSWTSLVPFKGYQLTNNSANGGVEYTFKGNLLGNEDGEYAFTSNGYGYFGNSYSAPIVISNFLSALDNAVYERTVWLYDAGADTYVSVNPLAARIGSAKYKDGTVIKEIRSLQAFILNKKADGGNAPINYRDAIWNNPRINSLVSAAPAREQANDMQWTNIYVEANGNKELVTLVEGADFSNEFDNGADAGKYINNNSMNLYAATNDGEQAIVATDNLANTLLTFQAGNATEYTLSFENGNEDYMLRDNVTGAMINMSEGAEYTFTQAANTTAQARFEVIGVAKMPTSIENVEETAKKEGIYTLSGQYVGRDFTKLPAGVYVVNGVKIVK
ncbi:MAG: hypothetical protein IJ920_05445 [Paludibacteraceae bacterium]|nr:hypothetical protein [Paludibacteraceae bacterium]